MVILVYNYKFYSRYNTDWIANTEMGLDPNNSNYKKVVVYLHLLQAKQFELMFQSQEDVTRRVLVIINKLCLFHNGNFSCMYSFEMHCIDTLLTRIHTRRRDVCI